MSSVQFCLTSKDFFICQKAFILGIFKAVRINPQKNIHFSDKVGVGGSSPLISTKTSDESQIFFNKFLAKKIHFRSKKIIKKNIALAMFGRDE